MENIIRFESYKIDRRKYKFVNKSLLMKDSEGKERKFYCIALVEIKSERVISLTGLEKYVINIHNGETTNSIEISNVLSFLNYLLYETNINSINEVTVNDINNFLNSIKEDENGKEIKSDSWIKIKFRVLCFLEKYYAKNHTLLNFKYNLEDYELLTAKPPKKSNSKHRNRVLYYGHLELLIFIAKMYDPMLVLPISIMAYAGIRVGGVVNIDFSDIVIKYKIAIPETITINLVESDKYRKGKSHSGNIKKIRSQGVYTSFVEEVYEAIEYHKNYLKALGYCTEGKNPILLNKHGKPMSAKTLANRIRDLFNNHFYRLLKETSENTPFEGETQAYIDSYEREYPGAHMFRHWFTMYLLREDVRPELVKKWRGDSPNSNSYEEYMHVNEDLIKKYKASAYYFQKELLKDIYE